MASKRYPIPNRMPKGDLGGRTMDESMLYRANSSDHPKGDPEAPDYSDYSGTTTPQGKERMMDVLQNLGQGVDSPLDKAQVMGDSGYNFLRGFVESPQGVQAYDLWKQTKDPTEFLDLFSKFEEYSYIDPNQLLEQK